MTQSEKYNQDTTSDNVFYSKNRVHKPVRVQALNDYILNIEYDDGKIINYDMKKLLNHSLFKSLKERRIFEKVTINGSAICWENDIDICADSIYREKLENV